MFVHEIALKAILAFAKSDLATRWLQFTWDGKKVLRR